VIAYRATLDRVRPYQATITAALHDIAGLVRY
jgi:hypothetical protein